MRGAQRQKFPHVRRAAQRDGAIAARLNRQRVKDRLCNEQGAALSLAGQITGVKYIHGAGAVFIARRYIVTGSAGAVAGAFPIQENGHPGASAGFVKAVPLAQRARDAARREIAPAGSVLGDGRADHVRIIGRQARRLRGGAPDGAHAGL